MAWLHSRNERDEVRIKHFRELSVTANLKMPDAGDFKHLIEYLIELDLCKSSGMGLQPFGFDDLISWQRLTGVRINSFESSTLINLSRLYVNSYNRFDKTNESDPSAILNPLSSDVISSQLKTALRSMKVDYG